MIMNILGLNFIMNKHNQKPTDIFNKQDVVMQRYQLNLTLHFNILIYIHYILKSLFMVLKKGL